MPIRGNAVTLLHTNNYKLTFFCSCNPAANQVAKLKTMKWSA